MFWNKKKRWQKEIEEQLIYLKEHTDSIAENLRSLIAEFRDHAKEEE